MSNKKSAFLSDLSLYGNPICAIDASLAKIKQLELFVFYAYKFKHRIGGLILHFTNFVWLSEHMVLTRLTKYTYIL